MTLILQDDHLTAGTLAACDRVGVRVTLNSRNVWTKTKRQRYADVMKPFTSGKQHSRRKTKCNEPYYQHNPSMTILKKILLQGSNWQIV